MKRLVLATVATVAIPLTTVTAGEPLPEQYFSVGAHGSLYRIQPDAHGNDFIERAELPGLQADYRFATGLSAQAWWARNNTRYEKSGTEADLNIWGLTLRRHASRQVLGMEPYIGVGGGEMEFTTSAERMDESFISLEAGVQNRIRLHWIVDIGFRAPHSVDEERWDRQFYLGLNHVFGARGESAPAKKKQAVPISLPRPSLRDSDRDGVPDTVDDCPGTPAGTRVDGAGCPVTETGDTP